MRRENVVWLSPSATTFSCLCESCLDAARDGGASFLDAVRAASVRGELAPETAVAFAFCAAGHQVVLRRVERPPSLGRRDPRQLQLV
jgi:hypothetical protein